MMDDETSEQTFRMYHKNLLTDKQRFTQRDMLSL